MKRPARLRPKAFGLTQRTFIRQSRHLFHNIAIEAGHVIVAWSGLHAAMLQLLLYLFPRVAADENRHPDDPTYTLLWMLTNTRNRLPAKIWQATKNEALQRQMLCLVADAALRDTPNRHLLVAINWLVARADELTPHRNDVAHVPLIYESKYKKQPWRRLRPDIDHAGRFPSRLLHLPNLTTHFRHIANDVHKLTAYAYVLIEVCELEGFDEPLPLLPDKPRLRLAGRSNPAGRSHRKRAAKPPRRPRSSPP